MQRQTNIVLALFAACSATLYCCFLPLWEGFDEPFHYGYVQTLATGRGFPVLRRSRLSTEISESLAQVPVSFILKRALPGTISFEDWYSLSPEQKSKRQIAAAGISPQLRFSQSKISNYEAQQAPLAYLALAPVDYALSKIRLEHRIFVLRLIVAFLSTGLTFLGCRLLCAELELKSEFSAAVFFCTFASQIFWASVAHVSNDWLSIPLTICFMAVLLRLRRLAAQNDAFLLSVILALGLLTKAYFIAFVPIYLLVIFWIHFQSKIAVRTVAISLAIVVALAGPWYARNTLLYRSVTGMQESVAGAGSAQVADAFFKINWPENLVGSARWGLWTGNESHQSFSQATLNLELLLLLAGLVLLCASYQRMRPAEWWLMAALGAFIAALAYDLCLTWVDTHGAQTTTGSYYAPCILPGILALAFLGLQRSGLPGRLLADAICCVTFWIALLSYAVKLIPFYGGFTGRSNLVSGTAWWLHDPQEALRGLTLVSPSTVFFLLALFLLLLLLTTITTIKPFVRRPVS